MKYLLLTICSILVSACITAQESPALNWDEVTLERIDLKLPLLIIRASEGMLACGYIDAATCSKTGEACAIVTGVSTHDDMLEAQVSSMSDAAAAMGVEIGMTGLDAVKMMQ